MADSDAAPGTPAGPPPPDTLGQMLRNARLAQDLTLEQLSTELRIEAKQLDALEQNRFERIGVPVFIKGYLKQYGTRLGLDVRDLLALYYKQTTLGDVEIQPSRTIKLRDERQITTWIVAAIVLLAVVGGLAAWWWNGGFGAAPVTRSAPSPAEAAPVPAPAAEPAVVPPPRTEPIPLEDAQPPPSDAPAPDGVPAQVPAFAAVEEADDTGDDARAVPVVAIPLEFTFEAESWAEVTDSRGQRLLFGLNAAGRRVTVRGEPPFAVVLGDANAVRLTVDGEPYEIPTTGRQGDLARFSVDIAEE
jgi:cytoskeleton protein RodZ